MELVRGEHWGGRFRIDSEKRLVTKVRDRWRVWRGVSGPDDGWGGGGEREQEPRKGRRKRSRVGGSWRGQGGGVFFIIFLGRLLNSPSVGGAWWQHYRFSLMLDKVQKKNLLGIRGSDLDHSFLLHFLFSVCRLSINNTSFMYLFLFVFLSLPYSPPFLHSVSSSSSSA